MGLLLFWLCISIVFSFLCSILEAVLLSVTPSYISILEQDKDPLGADLKSFKEDIDRPLSAILTLNTIAHTAGAIGVGASATAVWPNNELITGVAVPVFVTLAILILSELIPKTLGANYWKSLTGFTVKCLKFMMFVLAPLIWMSQLITKRLKKEKDKSVLSRVDYLAMTQVGEESGAIKKGESKIIQNLLKFESILVKDTMTPRTVVISAPETMTIAEFHEKHPELRFSRIPVFNENADNITGYFLKDQLLLSLVNKKGDIPLSDIKREIITTNRNMPIPELFNLFMEKREHIAEVVDEYGTMSGIVSMEDVIETLLGLEIMDEFDKVQDMQQLARKNWEKRAKRIGLIEK